MRRVTFTRMPSPRTKQEECTNEQWAIQGSNIARNHRVGMGMALKALQKVLHSMRGEPRYRSEPWRPTQVSWSGVMRWRYGSAVAEPGGLKIGFRCSSLALHRDKVHNLIICRSN